MKVAAVGNASSVSASLNGKLPMFGLAVLTILMNASRGMSTQSDGSDVGELDG